MLTAMERDQFNERRSSKLRDFIVDDQDLLGELIESADLEVVKDLTRALQLSPCFDDERDRRSLLGRILKVYPAMQALISGEPTRQDTAIIVSWDSLERRKNEYQDLVHKRIPANSKEIAIARGYGDLSENHEYKAAKEMQKLLFRRKHELEVQVARARGTDFAEPKTDAANIGTRVHILDLTDNQPETFTILGAWDGDPDQGIISYLSPMAQALIGHRVGEAVQFTLDNDQKRYRIDGIEAFRKSPPAATVPVETAPTAPATPAPASETTPTAAPAAEAVTEVLPAPMSPPPAAPEPVLAELPQTEAPLQPASVTP
jgi:transcription elongation GreA/GreB family factor